MLSCMITAITFIKESCLLKIFQHQKCENYKLHKVANVGPRRGGENNKTLTLHVMISTWDQWKDKWEFLFCFVLFSQACQIYYLFITATTFKTLRSEKSYLYHRNLPYKLKHNSENQCKLLENLWLSRVEFHYR